MRALASIAALAVGCPLSAGCHLAAGIEEAELIEGDPCSADADCDDAEPCTADRCAGGQCEHDPLDGDAPEAEQMEGDCSRAICVGGVLELEADDQDVPVDGLACTDDVCQGGMPDNPPLAGGTPCDEDGGQVCDGDGSCVECFSNEQCTAPDTCGGGGTPGICGCTPTPCSDVGLTCGFYPDDGCGGTLDCNNGMQDGDETDVDCGGSVDSCTTRCNAGQMCEAPSDCASSSCTMGVCDR